jgi:hypothetical protein
MRLSPLYLTFLLELCLLGLASFLRAILLWTFWIFYSKGGECETKGSYSKDMRPKGENVNIGREDKKGGMLI